MAEFFFRDAQNRERRLPDVVKELQTEIAKQRDLIPKMENEARRENRRKRIRQLEQQLRSAKRQILQQKMN